MKTVCHLLIVVLASSFAASAQTSFTDSLMRMVEQNKRDTAHLRALNQLAYELSRKDLKKQREYLHQGVALSRELNFARITNFYALLTTSHQTNANIDSAQFYLTLMENHVKDHPKDADAYENFNQTAGLFYKNTGRPRIALPYMLRALEVVKDSTNRAGQMLNTGNCYSDMGNMKKAAEYHLKSLALFEKVGNKRGQSFVMQGLGNDYFRLEQFQKARSYFERSLKMKEEMKDKRGTITAVSSIGNSDMELGDYEAAEKAFTKALQMATEMSITSDIGHALFDLAVVYKRMKMPEKAKDHYQRAIVIGKNTGDSVWVSNMRAALLNYNKENETRENLEYGLLASLHQYNEQGDPIGRSNAHRNMSEFYSQHDDYKKAFEHLIKSVNLNDSARGQNVNDQLRKFEEEYANVKRDREIELLKKDQELMTAGLERKQAVQGGVIIGLISVLAIGLILLNRYQVVTEARRLTEIEKMRNAIARDLHDDIGSTLSSINILSQLAINGGGDASKHFHKIAEQSGRMMESMSDIVWSISPGNDSLEQVVSKMKEFAAEILEPKNITFRFTGEDSLNGTTLSLDKRKNLFLIFKEAVNNAAKYSGATDLQIIFIRQGNTLSLSVSDNGGGFELESVKAGNGLKNMKERASALSARFDFVTRVSQGTRIALELPIT